MENVSPDLLTQKLECMQNIVHSEIFKIQGISTSVYVVSCLVVAIVN